MGKITGEEQCPVTLQTSREFHYIRIQFGEECYIFALFFSQLTISSTECSIKKDITIGKRHLARFILFTGSIHIRLELEN